MKKFFLRMHNALKHDPIIIQVSVWGAIISLILLGIVLMVEIMIGFIKNFELILGILFLILLFGGENIASYLKGKLNVENKHSCAGCNGCAHYYPVIRATMFTALRQSAAVLSLRPPETENMIVSAIQQTTDTLPRFTFKAMRSSPEPSELSSSVRISLLQAAVNDSFASFQSSFTGSLITGLYVENIREQNLYADLISVIPVCGFTSPHIEKCESERYRRENNELSHAEDEVYDDDF